MRRGRRIEERPRTPLDLRWPDTAGYTKLAHTQANEELERTITQLLEPCISRQLSGDEPYYVQHGPYENATRQPPPAQPPQYDLAFVLHQNPKVMWPLEAKLLRSDGTVAPYVQDIRNEFLTGRYAPYASSSAMLGYLLHGSPAKVLDNIEAAIACLLQPHPAFSTRHHRISDHSRNLPRADFVSGLFQCHHLILEMAYDTQTAGAP